MDRVSCVLVRGYGRHMTQTQPDPIDEEAAEIDARSEEAPEQIAELIEHAQEMGRDTELPDDVDGPDVARPDQ